MSTIFDEIKEHGGKSDEILFISNANSFENDGERTKIVISSKFVEFSCFRNR
jgi:hypothetical protein